MNIEMPFTQLEEMIEQIKLFIPREQLEKMNVEITKNTKKQTVLSVKFE